ncbi:nucleoside deaminase [Anaerobacillus sp. MEB173]|uniref:nucleoside deaminase n=1 Tax=Anaerobacillus sp. MEB173 TaxID=3383345 RepID=UPI003F8E4110
MLTDIKFMEKAIQIACENVSNNQGGPFGALVIKDGIVIGVGKNEVTAKNDPTAHAEVQAIRAACDYLQHFQLTGCEIYTSCEPCPMCIGAIYWARPKAVYFASTKEEAAKIGFDDYFIYDEIALPIESRNMKMKRLKIKNYALPFKMWEKAKDKKEY